VFRPKILFSYFKKDNPNNKSCKLLFKKGEFGVALFVELRGAYKLDQLL